MFQREQFLIKLASQFSLTKRDMIQSEVEHKEVRMCSNTAYLDPIGHNTRYLQNVES